MVAQLNGSPLDIQEQEQELNPTSATSDSSTSSSETNDGQNTSKQPFSVNGDKIKKEERQKKKKEIKERIRVRNSLLLDHKHVYDWLEMKKHTHVQIMNLLSNNKSPEQFKKLYGYMFHHLPLLKECYGNSDA